MTYAARLRARQNLKDWPGSKGMDLDRVDDIIERKVRKEMKGRTLCRVCSTYKSVSGVCFC